MFPNPSLDLLSSLGNGLRPPSPDEEAEAANAAVQQMLADAEAKSAGAQQMQQGALGDLQGAEAMPAEQMSPLTAGAGSALARVATTLGGPGGPDYAAQAQETQESRNKQMRTDRADNIKRLRQTYETAAKSANEAGDHEAELKSRVAIQKLDATEKKQLAADKVVGDREAKTVEFGREKEMEGLKHGYKLKELAAQASAKSKEKISPNEALKYINTLTDNIRQDPELKDYAVIRDQLTMGRDAYNAKDSAGDIILMRALARASDPRTGVKESEYATFESAQGMLASRGIALSKGLIGKGKLSAFGRKALRNRLETLHRRKKFQADRSYKRFEAQAKAYDIPGELALQAYAAEEESGVAPPSDAYPTTGGGSVTLYKGGVPHTIPADKADDARKNYGYSDKP